MHTWCTVDTATVTATAPADAAADDDMMLLLCHWSAWLSHVVNICMMDVMR